MKITFEEYKEKVYGCWLGKNIGGVLGEPFEGKRQVNDVSFYTQKDLNGNPPPNDDLDLQLIWLNAAEKFGRALNAEIFGEYWLLFVTPLWGEYGVAKTNLQRGLMPPLSGSYHNSYGQSNGCFIRSEIWACLAPGHPEIAVKYAYEDAIVDHHTEGVYAEIFCTALESAAFVESDRFRLIDIGLSYIPEDCNVAKAVRVAIHAYHDGKTWQEARIDVLTEVPGSFGIQTTPLSILKQQVLPIGEPGCDAPSHMGLLVLSWLYGENDFAKSICIATNCGEDADCTCATMGAIMGIIGGASSIPSEWAKPIQDVISTDCINLKVGGLDIPKTVTELTNRILRLTPSFLGRMLCDILDEHSKYSIVTPEAEELYCPERELYVEGIGFGNEQDPRIHDLIETSKNAVRFSFPAFQVAMEYLDGPEIRPNEPKHIRLTLTDSLNFHGGNNQWLKVRWYTPEGVTITPGREANVLLKVTYRAKQTLDFEVSIENPIGNTDLIADISVSGHHTYGLIKASFIPAV